MRRVRYVSLTIFLSAPALNGDSTSGALPRLGIGVGPAVALDVSGQWTNDSMRMGGPGVAPTLQDAGAITLQLNTSGSELVLELILQGSGAGVVARSIAEPYLKKGQLRLIRPERLGPEMTGALWLNELKDGSLEPGPRAFRRELERSLGPTRSGA